jgi:hypothetical protein
MCENLEKSICDETIHDTAKFTLHKRDIWSRGHRRILVCNEAAAQNANPCKSRLLLTGSWQLTEVKKLGLRPLPDLVGHHGS